MIRHLFSPSLITSSSIRTAEAAAYAHPKILPHYTRRRIDCQCGAAVGLVEGSPEYFEEELFLIQQQSCADIQRFLIDGVLKELI